MCNACLEPYIFDYFCVNYSDTFLMRHPYENDKYQRHYTLYSLKDTRRFAIIETVRHELNMETGYFIEGVPGPTTVGNSVRVKNSFFMMREEPTYYA